MKIGVTATQHGLTEWQKAEYRRYLIGLGATEVHHGDCIGGDSDIHDIARELNLRIVIHPPTDPKKRAFRHGDEERQPQPYHVRNRNIVDETDALLAGPYGMQEVTRSGTWATVRYARTPHPFHKPVEVIWPRLCE